MAVISFGSYIDNLLNKVISKVSFKSMKTILEKVLEHGSINLYPKLPKNYTYEILRAIRTKDLLL